MKNNENTRLLFLFAILLAVIVVFFININNTGVYFIASISQGIINFFNNLSALIFGTTISSTPSLSSSSSSSGSFPPPPSSLSSSSSSGSFPYYQNTECWMDDSIETGDLIPRCVPSNILGQHDCGNDGDCYKYKHSVCTEDGFGGFSCSQANGVGPNKCSNDLDCLKTYTKCEKVGFEKMCRVHRGILTSDCVFASDCEKSFTVCERQFPDQMPKCVIKDGIGKNQCVKDSDCK
ncbi:MAG: hypothetical protein AAB352_02835 [Patescibacteria group bacterium]